MSTFSLLASLVLHRQYRPLWGLLWTVGIMLIINIEYLESISFQLSSLATLGIIVFLTRVKGNNYFSVGIMFGDVLGHQLPALHKLTKSTVFSIFKDSLLVTLAAQSFVLPILLMNFGEISLISLVANTFLLWLTPFITGLGLFLVIFSWIGVKYLSEAISFFTWISIYIFEFGAGFLGRFEWGVFKTNAKIDWSVAILWWLFLFLIIFILDIRNKQKAQRYVF